MEEIARCLQVFVLCWSMLLHAPVVVGGWDQTTPPLVGGWDQSPPLMLPDQSRADSDVETLKFPMDPSLDLSFFSSCAIHVRVCLLFLSFGLPVSHRILLMPRKQLSWGLLHAQPSGKQGR